MQPLRVLLVQGMKQPTVNTLGRAVRPPAFSLQPELELAAMMLLSQHQNMLPLLGRAI